MLKVRKRDVTVPRPEVTKEDIVRLQAVVSETPPPDLTPIEAALREQKEEMKTLRAEIQKAAEKKKPVNYEFEILRDGEERISSVRAWAVGDTILETYNLVQ